MVTQSKSKSLLYQAGNLLYLAGWALTLIGLALIQDECKDHVRSTGSQFLGYDNIAFFVEPVGRDCNKGYRFFWFVWALSSIPPLLAIIASIKPELASGVSTSYFALIAPLTILMANSFYDATWLAKSDMEKRMEVVTAGFCVLAGASLLMLLLNSLLASASKPSASTDTNTVHDEHTAQYSVRGERAYVQDRSLRGERKQSVGLVEPTTNEPVMLPPLTPEPRASAGVEVVEPQLPIQVPEVPPPRVASPVVAVAAVPAVEIGPPRRL